MPSDITADSRISALAEAWYAGLTDLSPVTTQAHRVRLHRQSPRRESDTDSEHSIGVLDRHLRIIVQKQGAGHGPRCTHVFEKYT
jgi:hypothetical protein